MQPADLPFLIAHGNEIQWFSLLAFAGGLLGVFEWRRWRWARGQLRDTIIERARRPTGLTAGLATLRGRLRGTACTLIGPRRVVISFHRSDELWLEIDGERVELSGVVHVIAGTRATSRLRGLPAGAPAGLDDGAVPGRRQLYAVGDGDEVIVSGTLSQIVDAEHGYRDPGVRWVLRPLDSTWSIELTATAPASCPPAYGGPGTWMVRIVGTMIMSFIALVAINMSLCKGAPSPLGARMQIAAAIPGSITTLEQIQTQVERQPPSAQGFAVALALAQLRGGCAGAEAWLVEHARFEDALAQARGCDPGADFRALAYLGRYAEATDVAAGEPALRRWSRERAMVAIAAGRWDAAASAASDYLRGLEADRNLPTSYQAHEIERLRCMTQWLQAQGGAPISWSLMPEHPTAGCQLVAMLPDGPGSSYVDTDALAKHWSHDVRDLFEALRWIHDTPIVPPYLMLDDIAGPSALRAAATWLAPFASTDPTGANAAARHRRLALRAMLLGDLAGAAAELPQVEPEHRAVVAAAIELHTASTAIRAEGLDARDGTRVNALARDVALRRGLAVESHGLTACEPYIDAAMNAAVRGDGALLAQLISSICGLSLDLDAVLAVAPRITAHRAALIEALRLQPRSKPLVEALPFGHVIDAAFRRDALRLLGDEVEAARWQAQIAAQASVLGDRKRVTALLMWALQSS